MITSGNIIQEYTKKNFRKIITIGLESRHWSNTYRNWTKYFQIKSFWQQCVLIHTFLNQGEFNPHCSIIGPKDADFNPQCISIEKRLFLWSSITKKAWSIMFVHQQDAHHWRPSQKTCSGEDLTWHLLATSQSATGIESIS